VTVRDIEWEKDQKKSEEKKERTTLGGRKLATRGTDIKLKKTLLSGSNSRRKAVKDSIAWIKSRKGRKQ